MKDKEFLNIRAGFIHIPSLSGQVVNRPNAPSMTLDNIVRGLATALSTIAERDGKGSIETIESVNRQSVDDLLYVLGIPRLNDYRIHSMLTS